MNKIVGFVILLLAALLLIVSSVTNVKVVAQGGDSSSEKSNTAVKTCSPEAFKENPGLYGICVALAHNKESAVSAEKPTAEKPVENLNLFSGAHNKESPSPATIINAPIEVKKGPTTASASLGGIPTKRYCERIVSGPLRGMLTKCGLILAPEKLDIKKPATSTNPVSENCLQSKTTSGKSLCLTKGTLTPVTATEAKKTEKPLPKMQESNCIREQAPANLIGSIGGTMRKCEVGEPAIPVFPTLK